MAFTQNIFQRTIVPEKPRILSEERVYVYVPQATNDTAGVASYDSTDFLVNNGKVNLVWPMQMDIEQLADPIENISRIKVLGDEFEQTGEEASVTNPVTGTTYTSSTAEVKFKRTDRNAFVRPDFMQVDEGDFVATRQDNGYVKYTLRVNNPFLKPSLVKIDSNDFLQADGTVQVNWPLAHSGQGTSRTNGYGLVKIAPASQGYLKYDTNGALEVDIDAIEDSGFISVKPTYGGTKETGFTNIDNYVGADGLAKRDANNYLLLALTKDAVGLSRVANKSFNEYVYSDFGSSMQKTFTDWFDTKLDKRNWDRLFSDWNPPSAAKDTPQKWFEELEDEDESLRAQLRTIRLFLGYFDSLDDLTALYPASDLVYGSTAYLLTYRTYYAVRTQNVNEMADTDEAAKAIVPPKDSQGQLLYEVYVTGSRATGNRFLWTVESGKYRDYGTGDAIWLDYFLNEEEDLAPFVEEHQDTLKVGNKIGIRESGEVYIWNGTEAELSTERVYYEWFNTGVSNLSFMDFVERSASIYKPDGVPSAGSSGLWAQSDHVHPSDPKKLDLSTFQRTNVTVTSAFNSGGEDFVFNFYEVDGTGNYVPNRTVNIPYVRKGQMIHNYQGSPTNFVDSVESSEHYWAGSAVEFTAEKDYIPNNSLIVVDDNEDFIVDDMLNSKDLALQGITIDSYNPTDQFVITTKAKAETLIGAPLTISHKVVNGQDRYYLSLISELTNIGKMVVTKNVGNIPTIGTKEFTANRLLISSDSGAVVESTIAPADIIVTSRSAGGTALEEGAVVISGANNTVQTYSTGEVAKRLLTADGLGGIALQSFTSTGKILLSGANGILDESDLNPDNILVSSVGEEATVLPAGEIVITKSGNQLATFDTGTVANKMLVANGSGGLKMSTLAAHKLMYLSAAGVPAAFPMTSSDSGKFVGVDISGNPALLSAPAQPLNLPVTTFTTAPGANTNGTVLAILSADPGTYQEGVLYLW